MTGSLLCGVEDLLVDGLVVAVGDFTELHIHHMNRVHSTTQQGHSRSAIQYNTSYCTETLSDGWDSSFVLNNVFKEHTHTKKTKSVCTKNI